ncbi:PAS domain-containing hybrid sensor histidine kinase/response regulator [Pelagibius marinus]|uniref:PAS domain-containing hybrid sensor histidine kinase/response regulator n=1 Tax=Pelagibius marinus TaxID=2762760 RepID=UPI001872CF33|nr:PAS domain-containing sensor histidine kinase [Pelagibius marinus]
MKIGFLPGFKFPNLAVWVVAMAILLTVPVAYFVHSSIEQIRSDIPLTLSQQERDIVLLLHDLGDLAQAVQLARADPGSERNEAVLQSVDAAQAKLSEIRSTYNFDNMIGASAVYAVVNPALFDIRLWLTEGLYGFTPGSDQVLSLVESRAAGAFKDANRLLQDAGQHSNAMLRRQADRIERLRNGLLSVLLALAVLGLLLIIYTYRRHKAELALVESEARFQQFAMIGSDHFWETGPDHRFTYISDTAKTATHDRGTRIGGLRWDFSADLKSAPEKWQRHKAMLERHEPFRNFVYKLHDQDGRLYYCSINGDPLCDEDGKFVGYRGTATDVTARSLAEARVRELSAAVEQGPAGIAIADPTGRLIYCNEVFLQIIGFDREAGERAYADLTMTDILPKDVWQRLIDSIQTGGVGREEVLADRFSAGSYWGLISVASIRSVDEAAGNLVVAMQDISREKAEQQEREALERRLQQTGKMEAVGRLAGGIAHDFNNLLGAAMGFSQFLVDDLPEGSEQQKYAERIIRVSERGRDLVEQLLAFAGARDTERRVLDLAAVVESCRDLLDTSLPSSSSLVVEIGDRPLPVLCNAGQIDQILLNLCLNARDALGSTPGTIAIKLSQIRVTRKAGRRVELSGTGKLEQGRDYALLSVSDTGGGMDDQTRARIFEPFYTTKTLGRGTGLGLAVVHGIVGSYGGAICVESELGEGTTFEIYLPLEKALPEARTQEAVAERSLFGNERVLVVDDDPDLAQVLTTGLRRCGYEVMCFTSPHEAFRTVRETPESWDFVVSDQVMPGMTGLALISKLKELRPELRAILYTGFDAEITESIARRQGADALLHKPVSPNKIVAQIREIIDKQGKSP